jgi:hypothetical protein
VLALDFIAGLGVCTPDIGSVIWSRQIVIDEVEDFFHDHTAAIATSYDEELTS